MSSAQISHARVQRRRPPHHIGAEREPSDRSHDPLRQAHLPSPAAAVRVGGPEAILSLQRLAGNAAVVQLLASEKQRDRAASVGSGVTVQRKRLTYAEMLELRKQLTGQDTVSGLGAERQARRKWGVMNRTAKVGYTQGRQGVRAVGPGGERGGLGLLLKEVGKSALKHPGKMAAKSPRQAAFFGGMGAGMVGRAAAWAPEKFGWTGPKAERGAVAFGEESDAAEEETEEARTPTIEELDEMIRAHQRRAGGGEVEEEDEGESAVNF